MLISDKTDAVLVFLVVFCASFLIGMKLERHFKTESLKAHGIVDSKGHLLDQFKMAGVDYESNTD